MSTIDDLPSMVLVKIFRHYVESEGQAALLKNVAPVCKRWGDASTDPLLWTEIDGSSLGKEQLMELGQRGVLKSTRILRLSETCPGKPLDVSQLTRFFKNLRTFDVSTNAVSVYTMEALAENCPNIECLVLKLHCSVDYDILLRRVARDVLLPLLKVRGSNIKVIDLNICHLRPNSMLVWKITEYCHSLEELHLAVEHCRVESRYRLPVDCLIYACPRLRVLILSDCDFVVSSEIKEHDGLKEMKTFRADYCSFGGLDLYTILKNSVDLEVLHITACHEIILDDIPKIPSDKVSILVISENNAPHGVLQEAVSKWKSTLKELSVTVEDSEAEGTLETFLDGNPCPVLQSLVIVGSAAPLSIIKALVVRCRNLEFLWYQTDGKFLYCKNKKEVEDVTSLSCHDD